ncbi:MAG: ABC transporter ATP-binding protein, partial [Actinomycetota bacterium]|nr:ABC transporter ATP-binding protein [Actinomycetota bacterium]
LKDVCLDVPTGTTLGVVGHNGSGKSTLLRIMAGIYHPTAGSVHAEGQVASLMELGAGFHPELTGRDNVYLNGALMGLTRSQVRSRFNDIVDFSGIGEFIDTPVKHYSSGMYVRLGFSVAVNLEADIILIDEVIAVGDAEFQQRCKDHIRRLAASGRTVVLVSHVLSDVKDLCDSVVWLDHGKIMASGDPNHVTDDYVRAAREHSLSIRPSAGPVAIESISFFDRSGGSVVNAVTGEPLIVRMGYRASVPVDRPIFRLTIDHAGGLPVAGTNSSMRSVPMDRIEGPGYVDYVIDRLPLIPGTYVVSAWIYDETFSYQHDAKERAYILDVMPGSNPSRYGIVDLGGQWDGSG